jgi:hypothetical protein
MSRITLVHKGVIIKTHVTPKNRAPYVRENYQVVACGIPFSMLRPGELITPYDTNTTCPRCLEYLALHKHDPKHLIEVIN